MAAGVGVFWIQEIGVVAFVFGGGCGIGGCRNRGEGVVQALGGGCVGLDVVGVEFAFV